MSANLISTASAPDLARALEAASRLLTAYRDRELAARAALDAARLDVRDAAHWTLTAAVLRWEL